MNALSRLSLLGILSACAPVDDVSAIAPTTPTFAEGLLWTCQRAAELSCESPPSCEAPPEVLANVEARRCGSLYSDLFRCMMRPQLHTCALLATYNSRACVDIYRAAVACSSPTNPEVAPGAFAPAPADMARLGTTGHFVFHGDQEGSTVGFSAAITLTAAGASHDRLNVRLASEYTSILWMDCEVALTYDRAHRYHLDASATPECVAEFITGEHRLRFTAAAAYQLADELAPQIWLEATASGPSLNHTMAVTVHLQRNLSDG